MSIMDHNPKYAKLREWRKQHNLMVSPLPKPPERTIAIRLSCQDIVSSVVASMIVSPAMAERLARIKSL